MISINVRTDEILDGQSLKLIVRFTMPSHVLHHGNRKRRQGRGGGGPLVEISDSILNPDDTGREREADP
jgi:hypothetical protein